MLKALTGNFRDRIDKYGNILIALSLALSGLMPIILFQQAHAAQLTTRSVTISSSQPTTAGVSYAFKFTTATGAATIQSVAFSFAQLLWERATCPQAWLWIGLVPH